MNVSPLDRLEWAITLTHRKEISMFRTRQFTAATTFAMATAFWLLAGCAAPEPINVSLGTPAEGRSYDRKILIKPNTKIVNVYDGEVVKFIVQEQDGADKSFTWHFDSRETVGDLSQLAPTGVLSRSVKVYVGPNPLYF